MHLSKINKGDTASAFFLGGQRLSTPSTLFFLIMRGGIDIINSRSVGCDRRREVSCGQAAVGKRGPQKLTLPNLSGLKERI
jgi:hypothetical protein